MIVKTSSGARIFAISSGDASMVSPSGIGLPRRPSLKAHCSSQGTPEESLQALRLPSLHERARDYANLVIWSTRTRLTLRRASPDYPRKAGDVLSVCPMRSASHVNMVPPGGAPMAIAASALYHPSLS